ncbi:MAG: SAM-dependent methyltransferase [Sporocytophaga sp.]|nr:SAM-dependent methyltransferase [Sporocytophaga sp.]
MEDRNILTPKDYPSNRTNAKNFFDLLKNTNDTYNLFDFLKEKFNGDLFPVSNEERIIVSQNNDILNIIYQCYSCSLDFAQNQLSIGFKMFDFNYIPIELISAIYEEFMSEEDETKNIIKKSGAFYTPQMLVEFIYNEVLPMPSKNDCNYNIKILDPACGSGIFLVEGFKRIIERWKFSNNETELDEKTLKQLLAENIFGIETHTEAIKVTAFSLYLTFLHYMNPKKILHKVKFSPLIIWTSKKEVKEREDKTFGNNLLQASTFCQYDENFDHTNKEVKSFFKNDFDLVVGNPPWRRGNLETEIKEFSIRTKWNVGGDIVNAFLAYMPLIAPKAKIALITSVKVLFKTNQNENNFRLRFFTENRVNVIANFSIVSDILFDKAKQGAALLIYQKRTNLDIPTNESIIYCIPKTKLSIQNRKTIAIDASEIKYIPLYEVIKTNSNIFKIAMFGGFRDLKFISKLKSIPSIDELVETEFKGGGLHIKEQNKPFGNSPLQDNLFIPEDKIEQYSISQKGLNVLGNRHLLYRKNNKKIFTSPVILLNEGTKNANYCASLVEFDCVFLKSVYGFTIKSKSLKYHKALTTALNSSLASYYFFLISSSWGIERNRVLNTEAISFPALTEKFSTETINLLAICFDKIKKIISSESLEMNYSEKFDKIQSEIDEIIYSELKITKEEKALVDNALNYSIVLHNNYKKSKAEQPISSKKELQEYAQFYISVLNKYFKNTNFNIWIEIYNNAYQEDDLVCIKVNFTNKNQGIIFSDEDISDILKSINSEIYADNTESIYYRKVIKYEIKNAFYLIKPNQKRFWTKALALNDADSLLIELLNQKN